ncbi:hypothetical protein HOU78_gp39 [Vibrio phage 1.204.O._10N.222.46.F12]|uniref:Uncharacterized protein n=1 Tax=Vibrio phage 1.204.O._10N.222.46.F12 TaxID=1881263 RepID=A0A2I7RNP0_9CAUD|nr:hypothetical protein HOU78_gp39 [Vibrio phage 1.204.O._10N.222.46.F12]AUR95259.1 hypothetical protein NVP1204O_39 [Vibrio phage 1.204.O._10N.222.46.F12]
MKAGYYKLIDREGYLSSHQNNSNILKVYGHTLHVQGRGIAVVCKDALHPDTVLIYGSELDFFEYLGETLPKPIMKPVYRRNKRTPKAGEVWRAIMCNGEEAFYNILEVDDDIVTYELIMPYTKPSRLVNRRSIGSFLSIISTYQGIPQYRTFSH